VKGHRQRQQANTGHTDHSDSTNGQTTGAQHPAQARANAISVTLPFTPGRFASDAHRGSSQGGIEAHQDSHRHQAVSKRYAKEAVIPSRARPATAA
jgi:hypothetical protein